MYFLFLYLPVVEHAERERLTLCVCAKISLKAKRINSWNKSLDGVERRARDWGVLCHMTSTGHKGKRSVRGAFQKKIAFIKRAADFCCLKQQSD